MQPLYVLLVAGSLVNQLDSLEDVADIPLLPVFGDTLTTGNLFLLLTIPYFLVAVSAYPVSWLARVLQGLLHFSEGTREATTLVLRYLLIGAGVLWLMHRVGLNPNAIAAIAGGLSVGIGFGIKEVFSNFISGLWLLFEGSVRPGEILFIDGDPCEVRSLGLRAAVLWRDRDNAELVIPNQDFFTTTTVTYTGTDRLRRSQVEVAAAYRHDPAQVIPLLEDVARLSPRAQPATAQSAAAQLRRFRHQLRPALLDRRSDEQRQHQKRSERGRVGALRQRRHRDALPAAGDSPGGRLKTG